MSNNVLQSLLFITLNGPDLDTPRSGWTNRKNSLKVWDSEALLQEANKTKHKNYSIQTVPVCAQTEPIPLETDGMTMLEPLTKLSKDYLVSNLDGDSSISKNSSDDQDE